MRLAPALMRPAPAGTRKHPAFMLVRRVRPSMRSVILAALVALAAPAICQAERQRIDLNGPWQFRTDPTNQGVRDGWSSSGVSFDRTLTVPGSWQAQGVGEPRGFMR